MRGNQDLCHTHYEARQRRVRLAREVPCAFSGCDGCANVAGLCDGHYRQRQKGQQLTPLRLRRPPSKVSRRDEFGRKRCVGCATWLLEAMFPRNKQRADGLSAYCINCSRARQRASRYGLSSGRYAQIMRDQDGLCPVCGEPLDDSSLFIDHDHACCPTRKSCGRCVRGLLHAQCNTLLGMAGDSPIRLRAAAVYLEDWNKKKLEAA